jgi:hypothetical protein
MHVARICRFILLVHDRFCAVRQHNRLAAGEICAASEPTLGVCSRVAFASATQPQARLVRTAIPADVKHGGLLQRLCSQCQVLIGDALQLNAADLVAVAFHDRPDDDAFADMFGASDG